MIRTPIVLSAPHQLPSGGLKLPPFPPRPRDPNNVVPKIVLTQAEADNMKEAIYNQLDDLEGYVVYVPLHEYYLTVCE